MKEYELKKAHIYCKINKLNGQISGPLLEKYIIKKYGMIKNKSSDCIGDCKKNSKNIEIKCSLGGDKSHKDFNYVQIRLNHNIDIYLFTAYYINESNINDLGELFIFQIQKEDLIEIIKEFGQYAHGTIKEFGKTFQFDKEYALRPKINDNCWKKLLIHRVHEIII
jgi:hypothetical protein